MNDTTPPSLAVARGALIRHLEPELIFNRNPPLLTKNAVQVNRTIHFGDAVFRDDRDFDFALFQKGDQIADECIELLKIGRDRGMIRSELLQIVIKVRQINQSQVWAIPFFDPLGRCGDPAR